MFSVTVDDKEYKVEFEHHNPIKHNFDSHYIFGTDCVVYQEDKRVSEGVTNLHPLDYHSYKKNFGRKEAMDRALHKAFPGEDNKETRRKFWQAYYVARGNKW